MIAQAHREEWMLVGSPKADCYLEREVTFYQIPLKMSETSEYRSVSSTNASIISQFYEETKTIRWTCAC